MINLEQEFVESILRKFGKDSVVKLNLSNNGLKNLSNIETFCTTLKKLNLSKNEIEDIHPLSSLVNLLDLNLSENYM